MVLMEDLEEGLLAGITLQVQEVQEPRVKVTTEETVLPVVMLQDAEEEESGTAPKSACRS